MNNAVKVQFLQYFLVNYKQKIASKSAAIFC